MEQVASNEFLDGIIADRSPLDADPRSVTDAVNATVLSSKGNQIITSCIKSNVPIKADSEVVIKTLEVKGKGLNTSISDDVLGLSLKWLDTAISNFINFRLELEYTDGSKQELWNAHNDLTIVPNKDYTYKFEFDSDKTIKKLKIDPITTDTSDRGLCVLELYNQKSKYIGLPSNNKILGVKTFNDISYIVSGVPAEVQQSLSVRKHSQETLSDKYKDNNSKIIYNPLIENNGDVNVQAVYSEAAIPRHYVFKDREHGEWWYYDWKTYYSNAVDVCDKTDWKPRDYKFTLNLDFWINSFNGGHTHFAFYVRKNNDVMLSFPSGVQHNPTSGAPVENTMYTFEDKKSFTETFNMAMAKNDVIDVWMEYSVYENGQFNTNVKLELLYDSPLEIDEEEKISNFALDPSIRAATNNLSSDGGFFFNAPVSDVEYEVYIDSSGPFTIDANQDFNTDDIITLYTGSNFPLTHGLPPGEFIVSVSYYDEQDDEIYTRIEVITIGYNTNIEPLKLKAELRNFKGTDESCQVYLEVIDSMAYKDIEYVYGYFYDGLTEPILSESTKYNNHVFNFPALNTDTALEVFVYENTNYPDIIADTSYTDKLQRKCELTLNIYDKLKHNRYNVEIGTFPAPNYRNIKGALQYNYAPLFNYNGGDFICPELFLSGNHYLDMEIQSMPDDTVNIIFTEPLQIARQVNSGFAKDGDNNYEIKSFKTSAATTKPYTKETVDIRTRLIESTTYIPEFEVEKINPTGGKVELGSYQYYLKYGTFDGNKTGIVAETGLVPIFRGSTLGTLMGGKSGEETTCSVEFKLKNIDTSFDFVTLYYVHNTGDDKLNSQVFEIKKNYLIESNVYDPNYILRLSHTGYEPIAQIPEDSLSEQRDYYTSIKSIAQIQGRLMLTNMTSYAVDYTKLFEIGKQICVVPSSKTKHFNLDRLYTKWESKNDDFAGFTYNFLKEPILYDASIGDVNKKINGSDLKNLSTIIQRQGTFNPLFVSKYSSYWPLESYKYGVCFVLEGDQITRPVPILGGDFSNYKLYKNSFNDSDPEDPKALLTPLYDISYDDENTLLDTAKEMLKASKETDQGWFTVSGEGLSKNKFKDPSVVESDGILECNTLGVLRFPNRKYTGQQLFPKFIFDIKTLKAKYPEFFSKVKGLFFVRTERKSDALFEGFTLPTKLVPTTSPKLSSVDTDLQIESEIHDIRDTGLEEYSAVPFIQSNTDIENILNYMIVGHSESLYESSIGTFIHPTDNTSDFLNSKIKTAINRGNHALSYYALLSADIIPNMGQIAASFQGQSFSIISQSYTQSFVQTLENSGVAVSGKQQMFARLINSAAGLINPTPKALKVTGEFIPYGRSIKSGAGFASKIDYLAGRFDENVNGLSPQTLLPTGNYNSYIGLVGSLDVHDLSMKPVLIYPGVNGPLSTKHLKTIYNADTLSDYKSVTPTYTLNDVEDYMKKGVLGARGDCFTNLTWHNVASTLPAIGPNPTSTKSDITDEEGLKNLYNRGSASLNLSMVHASSYLAFARHNKVEDEVESALYGRARSFLPILNSNEYKIHTDNNSKLPESEGFNKGYTAPFTGRKVFNIVSNNGFKSTSKKNTIAFSAKMNSGSFYNAYRDFFEANSADYNKEFGPITKILNWKNNLLAVHTRGISYIGVNDQTILGNNIGGKVYTDSSEVLNPKARTISDVYGSSWIRSIKETDNAIYGVDVNNFKIWAIVNNNKLQVISDGKINRLLAGVLHDFKDKVEIPGKRYIVTHYDSQKSDIIFSFYNENSTYTEYPLPMDVDEFYLVDKMIPLTRELWVTEPLESADTSTLSIDKIIEVKAEVLRRKRILEQYKKVINNYRKTKHLTVIYNETTKTWTTRLSHSPEFAFNLNTSFYSINNENDSSEFKNDLAEYKGQKLIWDHNNISSIIPTYGSLYGADPIFELEFTINEYPKLKKLFKSLIIIGNEAKPSKVVYTLPDSTPWLNLLKETKYHTSNGYTTWKDIEQEYLDNLIDINSSYPITNPFTLVNQTIYDRRINPIFKANYRFSKTNNIINIGKNVIPTYWGDPSLDNMKTNFSDKWLKVRLRYTSGEYVYIKQILTNFNVIH